MTKEFFIGRALFDDLLSSFFEPVKLRSRIEKTQYNPENLQAGNAFANLMSPKNDSCAVNDTEE